MEPQRAHDRLCEVESRQESQIDDSLQRQTFIKEDHFWSFTAIGAIKQAYEDAVGSIDRRYWARRLAYAEKSLELNRQQIHSLVGNACSCGLGIQLFDASGDEVIDRNLLEVALMSTPGHFDHIERVPTSVFVYAFIEWREPTFGVAEAIGIKETRWNCVNCGLLDEHPEQLDGSQVNWAPLQDGSHLAYTHEYHIDRPDLNLMHKQELQFWAEEASSCL